LDTLTRFNQQILQCQDDAYTLAWYLLGDEFKAEAVTQKAVEAAYHCFSQRHDNYRLLILQQIVNLCRERTPAAWVSAEPDIFHGMRFLAEQERVVLALVDVLGLDYPEAAWVTDKTLKEIGQLLARARRKMIDHKEFAPS